MQYLKISNSIKLSELSDIVGDRNVEHILTANNLPRVRNIGSTFDSYCDNIMNTTNTTTWQQKSNILNTLTSDSDIFETASLLNEDEWKVLSTIGTFRNMLKIPETIILPDSADIIGNSQNVSDIVYSAVMSYLQNSPHKINPDIFNTANTNIGVTDSINTSIISDNAGITGFRLPWGVVSLYSSLANTSIDIPVYPEEVSDSAKANYTTMPDLVYQYEPWQLYESSGPRSNTYEFTIHRDMWTGDHRDGKCNELVRFCQANCYPKYNGASVHSAIVTLYVNGKSLISGIMTEVSVNWSGPIGLDGWYLVCKLSLSITEVSQTILNYDNVKSKPLIG